MSLLHEDIKSAIINTFEDLKETISEEPKGSMTLPTSVEVDKLRYNFMGKYKGPRKQGHSCRKRIQ